MAEIVIPPSIVPTEETVELVDDGTAVFRPVYAPGQVQRQQASAPRWRVTQRWQGLRDSDMARMMAVVHALRGRYNTLRAVVGAKPRGNMPATEAIVNGDFANGTASWTPASEAALGVRDQTLRITRTATTVGTNAYATATVLTLVQFAPYLLRLAVTAIRGIANPAPTHGSDAWALGSTGWDDGTDVSLRRAALQPSATAISVYADNVTPVSLGQTAAGDYYDISFCTMARCVTVDNGRNSILYSDQIDNAVWTKLGCSVTANATASPFGDSTADKIVESSGGTYHYILQAATRSSAADTACSWGFFKGTARNVTLWIGADSSANGSSATFDLIGGTGAGAVTNIGTATHGRTSFYSAGGGWYYCAIVSRIPATTSIQCVAYLNNGSSDSYSGDGASWVGAIRLGCAITAYPPYSPETVSSARASGENQSGSSLRVKGGPASGSGLLLAGDYVDINGELKRLTSAFDTDGAGRGTLQFEPELFTSPGDHTPVALHLPMGKFILSDPPRWTNRFGRYADLELTFESINEP